MVNRRSDLLTRRFSYFGTWESIWVGDSLIHSDLVYQDFKIISFLNGLFKKLAIPTSKFKIVRYLNNFVIVETDLYVIRPFWILYSHLSQSMESSFLYYFVRLFFKMPKLMFYTNRNKYMYLNIFSRRSHSFFFRNYRKKLKYFQLFINKSNILIKNVILFLNTYLFDFKESDRKGLFFNFFKKNFFQYIFNLDNYLTCRSVWSYDAYYVGIYFFAYNKKKFNNLSRAASVSSIVHDYYKIVIYNPKTVLHRNKVILSQIEILQKEFYELRSRYFRDGDVRLDFLKKKLRSIEYLKSKLFPLYIAEYYYIKYLFFGFIFRRNLNYFIRFSFIKVFRFLWSTSLSRSFNSFEVRIVNNVIRCRSFLLFVYKFFIFSKQFRSVLKKNRKFTKLLNFVFIINKFLLFVHMKIYGKRFRFNCSNISKSLDLFIFKILKSLPVFFKLYNSLIYRNSYITNLLFSFSVICNFFLYRVCKINRGLFFHYLFNIYFFFSTSYIIKYSYGNICYLNTCLSFKGLFNFYFFFYSLNIFLFSNVFMKLISCSIERFRSQFKLFFILKNMFFTQSLYYYNYYYHLICVFFFNYLLLIDFKFVGLFLKIQPFFFEFNKTSLYRITMFKKDVVSKSFYLLALLNRFIDNVIYNVRSNLFVRRLFIVGYYKSVIHVQSFSFLFWFLRQLKLMFPSWKSFLKKYRFRYLKLRKRNFLFLNFKRLRTRFFRIARRRILKYFFFLNKSMYSFMLIKLFVLSFDKLVQNLELVFSEYLQSKVLFLPNIYFERFRSIFWRRRRILNFTLSSRYKRFTHKKNKTNFIFSPFRVNNTRRVLSFASKKKRRKNRNKLLRFYSSSNNFLTFMLFFNCNKVLLLKTFGKLFHIYKSKRLKRLSHKRIISFFIRYVKRVYFSFFYRKFLLKKKNLKKLCFILSTYRTLLRKFSYNISLDKRRSLKLTRLFTIRNFKQRKRSKRFFRLKWLSKRRRFFLKRYGGFGYRKSSFYAFRKRFRRQFRRRSGPPSYSSFPPIKDAKLLCDYIVYYLNMRVRLYRIFSNLRFWQKVEYRLTNTLKHTRYIDNDFVSKKYPLSGIRILCSGSFKKGGRKKKNYYHLWIRNQRFTRKMPLQTIEMDIDYFSSNTHVVTGTVGVKVWLCFSTISYRYKMNDNAYYV